MSGLNVQSFRNNEKEIVVKTKGAMHGLCSTYGCCHLASTCVSLNAIQTAVLAEVLSTNANEAKK